jgi:glycosyltransferase involved in cell wall biosynthesis
MRIGLSCTTIEPALTHGKIDGIGVYTKNLYEQFSKLHQDITPFSFPSFSNWIKSSSYPNGKIFPLPFLPATAISLAKPAARLLYGKCCDQIDLLHVTDHMVPRISKTPVIATIHDALMFTHPEWYPSRFRSLKNRLRKKTFHWAQHFITVSHAMVSELEECLGIDPKKISVVHNGLPSWWHEKVSEIEKKNVLTKLGIPEKFILCTGTLQQKKNFTGLIHAYSKLPKDLRDAYPLVIAGKSGWGVTETLAAIKKLVDEKAGFWLDYVNLEEIRILYQAATAYVFPSLHEGFGLTLLEAFASGTPVITSNIPALREVAGDAAILVDPKSTHDISKAIQHLLEDKQKREDLIQKGLQRVKEFTLENCARNTLNVYEQFSKQGV